MTRIFLAITAALAIVGASAFAPTRPSVPTVARSTLDTRRHNLFDTLGSIQRNWGKKVEASHILFSPSNYSEDAAKVKLTEMKEAIGDDPEKFAEMAKEMSNCPSAKSGGSLGEFSAGQMVKNFDAVCFSEEVGVVQGPVSTQFGEHLILITKRTGDN